MHSKFNCLDENLDLDFQYEGAGKALVAWPTALCRLGATKSCVQKNGIEVRVNNLHDTYQCHCKPGYFGTYADNADGSTLIRCNFCPKYGVSLRGTRDVLGCYCRAGTYEVVTSAIVTPDLVCRSCPSLSQYCPGGPSGRPIFDFVFDTVAKEEAVKIVLLETGAPVLCPTNTSTRHRFASSVASCIANTNMRYDVRLGYWVFCDDSVYSSANITQWLEPKSQGCNRMCKAPSSVADASTGNCRCDASKGYGLKIFAANKGAACVCQPGWYQFDGDSECVPCPRNSYCDGTVRQLCAVQFATPMYAKTEAECVCLPGFYFLASSTSCKFCQTGRKCPGGRAQDTSFMCSPEEECRTTGMYIPLSCPRGTTKTNLFENTFNSNSQCSSNGVVKSSIADTLYSNAVQKIGQNYGVNNVKLVRACRDAVFLNNLNRVLAQEWPMPVVGFFGAFQWLCGTGRVLVRNTSYDGNGGVSGANVLDAAFDCARPTFAGQDHANFLVNAGQSVLAWRPMGLDGFMSASYHDTRVSLLDPDDHLTWNIFLTCDFRHNNMGLAGVSEIDTCVQCDVRAGGGFLVLGVDFPHFPHIFSVCLVSCIDATVCTHNTQRPW